MHESAASDSERFLALLLPLERDLETYCRRLIWQPHEAPDALQNAVLRAFAAFNRYHEGASFRAWMFKILTNEVFAMNRRHARIAKHEFQLEPDELARLPLEMPDDRPSNTSEDALMEALDESLVAGLKTLTDTERAVLLMRALPNLRYREIADSLEIPLGSVMGNLSRARQKMRLILSRHRALKTLPKDH